MKKNKVYFIDYSSFDNYGLYIHEIKSNINPEFSYQFFVHSAYKYDSSNSVKLFNWFSDKIKLNFINKMSRFFEMYFSFLIIFFKIILDRHKSTVIVSLYQPFITYNFLFNIIKLSNSKLVIVVHDLIPLASNYPKFILASQNELLNKADEYIVHNVHSKEGLRKYGKKIHLIRFPIMKLESKKMINTSVNDKIKFLFLGHLRKEKGIQLLIDVWRKFSKKHNNVELVIAGSSGSGVKYNFKNLKNFKSIIEYIDDDKYFELIKKCNYGILPYEGGTNSGVLSTIVALNRPVITSDISLFKDSDFSINELMFKSGDENDFLEILQGLMRKPEIKNENYKNIIIEKLKKYKDDFKKELNITFEMLTND
jgi:glycosyltransferase involved in cell wall biosynthesis